MSARILILSERVPVEFTESRPWIPRMKNLAFSQSAEQRRLMQRMCMKRLRAERKGGSATLFPDRIRNRQIL